MICLKLTASSLEGNRQILEQQSAYFDLAELRADLLDVAEWYKIKNFAAQQSIKLILSMRRVQDGGSYKGCESQRLAFLENHLSNFSYLEIEEDVHSRVLEEKAQTAGVKLIHSLHSPLPLSFEELQEKFKKLCRRQGELFKLSMEAHSLADTEQLLSFADSLPQKQKRVIFATGSWGELSSVCYRRFSSLWCYADSAKKAGSLSAKELKELYRSTELNEQTHFFAIVGDPVDHSRSPVIHNTAFQLKQLNACFVKLRCDDLNSLFKLAQRMPFSGFSVTTPHKLGVMQFLGAENRKNLEKIGSCNTLVCKQPFWQGYNTDVDGVMQPLERFFPSLQGVKCVLIGAGGAARSTAFALCKVGAKVLILARRFEQAQQLAQKLGCAAADLQDGLGIPTDTQLLIQASSAGLLTDIDPAPDYNFSGDEVVFEMVYKLAETRFLKRARTASCQTIAGIEMLDAQAKRQQILFSQCCHG